MLHGNLIAPDDSQFDFKAATIDGSGDFVTIPDAHLLFTAEFKRVGDDLKLTGEDGKAFIVSDYFKSDHRPTLVSPDGAPMRPDLVAALVGPIAPGQYAQAGAQPSGQVAIGKVATLSGNVTVVRNGVAVTLNNGDSVLKGDVVQTGANSAVGIVFLDGSAFNLSANARMVLSDFVFEQGGNANSQLFNLVQGGLTFVSGQIASSGSMKIGTPVATMGIRGTVGQSVLAQDGSAMFTVVNSGGQHAADIFDANGNLIAQATSEGGIIVVRPISPLQVIASEIGKDSQQLATELAALQAVLNTQSFQQQLWQNDPNAPKGTNGQGTQLIPSDPFSLNITINNLFTPGPGGGSTFQGVIDGKTPVPDFSVPVNPPPFFLAGQTGAFVYDGTTLVTLTGDGKIGFTDIGDTHVVSFEVIPPDSPWGTFTILSISPDTINGNSAGFIEWIYEATRTTDIAVLAEGETHVDHFRIILIDSGGNVATLEYDITIVGVNDAPVAAGDNFSTSESAIASAHYWSKLLLGNVISGESQGGPISTLLVAPSSGADSDIDHGAVLHISGMSTPTVTENDPGLVVFHVYSRTPHDSEVARYEIVTNYGDAFVSIDADGNVRMWSEFGEDPFRALGVGESATIAFNYTLSDEYGATDTGHVEITVDGTNDQPVAFPDILFTTEARIEAASEAAPRIVGNIKFNDHDVDGDSLTLVSVGTPVVFESESNFSILSVTAETAGTDELARFSIETNFGTAYLAVRGNGTVILWSDSGEDPFRGLDFNDIATIRFAYTVSDGNGGTATTFAYVNVQGTNDAPVATLDAFSATEDQVEAGQSGARYEAGNVLSNDSDVDADALSVTSVSNVSVLGFSVLSITAETAGSSEAARYLITTASGNAHLAVGADGSVTLWSDSGEDPFRSLATGEAAAITFDYVISDGHGGTSGASASVTVEGSNDQPTVGVDSYSMTEAQVETAQDSSKYLAGNVLSNDSDPDTSDVLSVTGLSVTVDESVSGLIILGITTETAESGEAARYKIATNSGDTYISVTEDGKVYIWSDSGEDPFRALSVGQNATIKFDYNVSDGNSGTATGQGSVVVSGTNDGPSLALVSGPTYTDTAIANTFSSTSGTLSGSDPDSADTLSYGISGGSSGSTVISGVTYDVSKAGSFGTLYVKSSTGQYVYVPDNTAVNATKIATADDFSFTVSDGTASSSTAFHVTINGANDTPSLASVSGPTYTDTSNADSFSSNSGTLSGSDRDSGETLIYGISGGTTGGGTVISGVSYDVSKSGSFGTLYVKSSTGQYVYVPNNAAINAASSSAADDFNFTVSDGTASSSTGYHVTINGTNDKPVAVTETLSATENQVETTSSSKYVAGNLLTNDTDAEGNSLAVTGVSSVSVNESISGFSVSSIHTESTISGEVARYGIITNFGEAHISVGSDGKVYLWSDSGDDPFERLAVGQSVSINFTYAISDGHGGTSSVASSVTINGSNDQPDASGDSYSATESAIASASLASKLLVGTTLSDDSDPDGDSLTVSGVSNVTVSESLSNFSISSITSETAGSGETARFKIETNAGTAWLAVGTDGKTYLWSDSGEDPFRPLGVGKSATIGFDYAVSDGNGGTDTAHVNIAVSGSNDAPSASSDSPSATEDNVNAASSSSKFVAGNLLTNDNDPDGDSLTVTSISNVALHESISGFSFDDLDAETAGSGEVARYRVRTDSGDAHISVGSDGRVFLWSDSGEDPFGKLKAGQSVSITFNYAISDGNGGSNSSSATVTINGANDAPSASGDSYSASESSIASASLGSKLLVGTTLSNDSDPDGDSLTVSGVSNVTVSESLSNFSISSITSETAGSGETARFKIETNAGTAWLAVGTDGKTYLWSDSGEDPFRPLGVGKSATIGFDYAVSDGNGGTGSAHVNISVSGSNDSPSAVSDTGSATEDQVESASSSSKYVAGSLLGNDTDPDADTLTVTSVSSIQGNESISGFSFSSISSESAGSGEVARYKVTTNSGDAHLAVGTDGRVYLWSDSGEDPFRNVGSGQSVTITFNYAISDGNGGTSNSSATITINGSAEAPVSSNDSYSVNEDTTLTINSSSGVLSNDSDADTSSSSLSAVLVSGPAHGTLTLNGNGSFVYTPDKNYSGSDSFTYRTSDGSLTSAVATASITVNAINDTPVILAPSTINYWTGNSTGEVLAINQIAFADADSGSDSVTVTFALGTGSGALNADNISDDGVSVSGSGTTTVTLTGSIADINAYLAADHLHFDPPGSSLADRTLSVTINDGGNNGSGGSKSASMNITLHSTSFSFNNSNNTVDLHAVHLDDLASVSMSGGDDTLTTAWSHSAVTTYDGGTNGATGDSVKLVFTAAQFESILSNSTTRGELTDYLDGTPGSGSSANTTLDLSSTSWGAKVQGFEHASIALAVGADIVNTSFGDTLSSSQITVGNSSGNTQTVSSGNNILVGLGGNDTLTAGSGNDVLLGGAGQDTLITRSGNTISWGGSDADTFKFDSTFTNANNHATVLDFTPGEDTMGFDDAAFTSVADIFSHSAQVGADVVITVGTSDVVLKNVSLATLHGTDFFTYHA